MIETHEELLTFLQEVESAQVIAVDTETNGLDVRDGTGYLIGISIATVSRAEYLPFRHDSGDNLPVAWAKEVGDALNRSNLVIFHNAKFDLVSLSTIGINLTARFYCTMLMAHMVKETYPSKALDWLGRTLVGEGKVRGDKFDHAVAALGWAGVPVSLMRPYAEQDAALTLKLFLALWPEFKSQGFNGELWDIEVRFIRLLIKMEAHGIRIDKELCGKQAFIGDIRMQECAEALGFNPGSPKQLGHYLLNVLELPVVARTEKGAPSFDKAAMEKYDELLDFSDNPTARLVKEYRGWQKACSTAYNGYRDLVSPDGRLRPNYKIHGTVTGRLSCEKPNLQQIPRASANEWNGSMKQCFIPRPGYELWEADYSQLEFRLGAAYAKEKSLLDEFAREDSDVFTRMAGELGFSRGDTKTLTYTLQYGGGINRLCNVFKVDPGRAAEIRDTYFDTYPGFRLVTGKAAEKAKAQGWISYWSGRRRHFAYPSSESFKAFNSVIQGGSAEIVKRAMLRLSDAGFGDRMLLQVHDSVVFELPEGTADTCRSEIVRAMTEMPEDFGVKFAVDFHRWGS